ncbi:MAG: ATP-dependent protease ATPase subunit HslU, partial [Candidatus Hydrogenedentota bacterium]
EQLTPRQIVEELDKYIIGQNAAKRKVAIALRNRWRRQHLGDDLRDEVAPKNIIMIGPTGVGKTEIARRLSKLVDAPFIKVEASKFTEVGYVGRDCESMIRELTEVGVNIVRNEMKRACEQQAKVNAHRRVLDILMPPQPHRARKVFNPNDPSSGDEGPAKALDDTQAEARARELVASKLSSGDLDDREIEISVRDSGPTSMMQVFSNTGLEEMGVNIGEMFGKFMPQKTKTRKTTIREARKLLENEELDKLVDMEAVVPNAIARVENAGIVFLDEIDKIASRQSKGAGPDISREGVQRDILPIVEGSTVTTKYGPVKTDHILFIAAGAFHISKVSDLIPELQGRFPIRVELDSLDSADFARILREPKNSLVRQYESMLATEGVTVKFQDDAIDEMARICQEVNDTTENIGARRLHTIMEYLLEEISFTASERGGQSLVIDAGLVRERLAGIREDRDLSRYVL